MTSRVFRRIAVTALGVLALAGCAHNPVSGDRDFVLMPEQQEIQMGAQANKPLIVTVGHDFVGLIMPRRSATNSAVEVLATWQGVVPVNGLRKPGSAPLSVNQAQAS